jgi:hypothetical protein
MAQVIAKNSSKWEKGMVRRKERPNCRKVINGLLRKQGCTLEQLMQNPHRLSPGMQIQARKMLDEGRAMKCSKDAQNFRKAHPGDNNSDVPAP